VVVLWRPAKSNAGMGLDPDGVAPKKPLEV
jgi:hypothetical protein